MSHIRPDYFKCTHKNLTKNKFNDSYTCDDCYTCDRCNKDFVMIKARHDPIYPILPKLPKLPNSPEEIPHPFPNFPAKKRGKFPKYL